MSIIEKLSSEINKKYSETLDKSVPFNNTCIRLGHKNHVWIYAHEWTYKGNIYQEITFGSWRYGDQQSIKSWDAEMMKDKNFKKAYRDKTREAKGKIDHDKKIKQKECAIKWKKILENSPTCAHHDYLEYKNVKPYGLKQDQNGTLLIPCSDINGITGVQRIFKDPETERFEKRFSAGIKINGSIHALKGLKNHDYCYLTEGYATAATIQEIYPNIPVVACFSANNIPHSIQTIREIYPNIRIVIAADNDHSLERNVGVFYAKKAAKSNPGIILKIPKFSTKNSDWSDFNDLAEFESRETAAEQLYFTEDEFTTIFPLGHNEGIYYYISTENQQIIPLPFHQHNKAGFRRLCANKEYWLKNYGIEKDEDSIMVSWDNAADDLVYQCHKKGIFDPQKVRGIGVWQDGKNYVINDGQKLINPNPDSKYLYQKTIPVDYSMVESDPNTLLELLEAFKNLEYKTPNDYFFLSSWYIQTQIFATIPWRFHIWVSGEAGTGKSTILKWIADLCMNPLLTNNTTVAGLRQKAKSNATTIIFDEAEPKADRTKDIIGLAREMSSNGSYQSLRGTNTGKVINYNTQVNFCMGSIQIDEMNQADRSRFFTIEMASTKGQDPKKYADIQQRIDYFTARKGEIFHHIYNGIDTIKQNTILANSYLKDYKMESRLADQLSVAIACYFFYFNQGELPKEYFQLIMNKFDLINSEYKEENETKEHEEAYDALMSTVLDAHMGLNVAGAIHDLKYSTLPTYKDSIEKAMVIHGLVYDPSDNTLFIHSNNRNLTKKMEKYPDLPRLLGRYDKIIVKKKTRKNVARLGYVRGIIVRCL